MKKFILIPILCLVACCSAQKEGDLDKIEKCWKNAQLDITMLALDWQNREFGPNPPAGSDKYDAEAVGTLVQKYAQAIRYDEEKAKRMTYFNTQVPFQTVKETDASGKGVCIDESVWEYANALRQGADGKRLAVIIFMNPFAGIGHSNLCVLDEPGQYDSWSRFGVAMFEDLRKPPEGMLPIVGFDAHGIWFY